MYSKIQGRAGRGGHGSAGQRDFLVFERHVVVAREESDAPFAVENLVGDGTRALHVREPDVAILERCIRQQLVIRIRAARFELELPAERTRRLTAHLTRPGNAAARA